MTLFMAEGVIIYGLDILVIFFLILLNGVFAMAEIAVVSSRKPRLKALAEHQYRGANAALKLTESPGRFLSAVQVGITLVGILAGVFGGEELAPPLEDYLGRFAALAPYSEALAILTVVVCITYASIILGELVPKQIALKNPERVASIVAWPMARLTALAMPIVYVLEVSSRFFLGLFGTSTTREPTVTEAELKATLAEGVQEGILVPAEQDMIKGVMRLGDWRVRAIMTPRPNIAWIDLEADDQELRRQLRETPYSRVLVASDTLDNLLGIVQAKDLLDHAMAGESVNLRDVLRQPLYVHAHMSALKVVEMLKASPLHMAVVVDEYGSIEGIVTPTDVLKTIVGSLVEPGVGTEPDVVQREDGSWLIDGDVHIDVIKDLLDMREIPGEGDFYTLAGFLLSRFEKVPDAGDYFEWQGFRFEVVDMDDRRIDKILVAPAT
jgi:putative hemolysin